jgi:hypothetical protein
MNLVLVAVVFGLEPIPKQTGLQAGGGSGQILAPWPKGLKTSKILFWPCFQGWKSYKRGIPAAWGFFNFSIVIR